MMAFAGALEIHTFGKTMSTYRNEHFNGGLFLAELVTEWQFKDYQQQPGMLNLLKGEDTNQAQITTDATGKLQLVVPNNSRMARAASTGASEIIWLVTDTIITAGSYIFPPPFSWLIRGGWWIVKKAAGVQTRAGSTTFDIYASISDARSDTPCISTQPNAEAINVGGLHFQQITPGNAGIGADVGVSRAIEEVIQTAPTQCYATSALRLNLLSSNVANDSYVPSHCAWYTYGDRQNYINGVGFMVGNTRVATFNLHKVTVATNAGPANPNVFDNQVPFYLLYNNNQKTQVGYAVASQHDHMDNTPSLRVSSVLVYATRNEAYNFQQQWKTTTVQYPVNHSNNANSAKISTPTTTENKWLRIKFEAGSWYVAQFVVQGVTDAYYKVGNSIVATRGTGSTPTGDNYFVPNVNDASTGLLPVYISGLHMNTFTTSDIRSDVEARTNAESLDLEPSFGCDDALEFPPPPPKKTLKVRMMSLKIRRTTMRKNLSLAQMIITRTHQCPGWWYYPRRSLCLRSFLRALQNGKPAWQ